MLRKFKDISNRAYNLPDALKEAKLEHKDIDDLRLGVEKFEHVPKTILDKQVRDLYLDCCEYLNDVITSLQLLPFLVACGNNKEKAIKLISNHYDIKRNSPEFFKHRDVDSAEVQSCLRNQNFVILPSTPDNCNLLLFRLSSYEPSDYDFDHTAKTYIMSFGEL